MKSDLSLWIYVLAAPLVWFASLETNFALAALGPQGKPALYLISVAALVITASVGYLAWTNWRQLSNDGNAGSRRSLSMGAVVLSVMFFIVILAQALPNFLLKGDE